MKKSYKKKSLGCACQNSTLNGPASTVAKEVGIAVLPKVIGWTVGIGALYFLVIKPVLQKVGVVETKESREEDQRITTNATMLNNPFSPRYYQERGAGAVLLTRASAEGMAAQIYNAIGNFYDDENAIYGVFRQLKYKTQVSFLSDVFYKKYGVDMYNLLQRNLSQSELATINAIVNALL